LKVQPNPDVTIVEMSFFSKLNQAAKAALDYSGAARYEVRGEEVKCPVCRGNEFALVTDREVKRPLLSRRNLPWLKLDRNSTTLICVHCTHHLRFGRAPERVEQVEP